MRHKTPNPGAACGGQTGVGVVTQGPWKPDCSETDSPPHTELQAARLRRRFRLSLPLALATAELAYASGRPA